MTKGKNGSEVKETKISDISGFLSWIKKLENGDFLFRGQANKSWPLRSGAVRRICGNKETDEINYGKVEDYIEELLETVRDRELDKHNNNYTLDCDLKILAELQHFGAATPLLDFSKNSLIALWMACSDQPEKHGKVFAFNTDQENIKRVKNKQLKNDFKFSDFIKASNTARSGNNKQKYYSWIWEPSHFNKRIPAQSSIFFLAREEYSFKVSSIIIAQKNKTKLLRQLENMFGLKEENIYPDFAGFAQANGTIKAYQSKDENHYTKAAIKLIQLEDFTEAVEACNHAIRINKNHAEAYLQRGVANGNSGKHKKAMEDFTKTIELNINDEAKYYNRGLAKDNLGQYKEAIKDFDKAIKLDPNYISAYNRRGIAKRKIGEYQKAIKDYNRAIKLDSSNSSVYNSRGIAKLRLGQHKEAIKDFDKAIKLDPSSSNAYNSRGFAKHTIEKYKEAIRDYDKAIELDTDYNYVYINRGKSKFKLKQYDEAHEDFLRGKELAEENNDEKLLEAAKAGLLEIEYIEKKNLKSGHCS